MLAVWASYLPGQKLIAYTYRNEASGQLKIALIPFFLIFNNLHRYGRDQIVLISTITLGI